MKKRVLWIALLLLVICFPLFACESQANNGEKSSEGLMYTLLNNSYSISGYKGADTDVFIPSHYNGYPVTSIASGAFNNCYRLTSIKIPNSIISIGEYAFKNCYKLTIYCNVKSQPDGWNSKWNEINEGNYCPVVWDCKNNNIADDGYMYGITVDGINYAIKDRNAKVVGTNVSDNVLIPSIITYNSTTYPVTSIASRAFNSCYRLTNIEIPNRVTSIGEYAFYDCYKLIIYCEVKNQPSGWNRNWNISNCPIVWDCKNNNIANDGFVYTIIDGINYAIRDNTAKVARTNASKDIVIPSTITYNLRPYSVTSIGKSAFVDCDNLESIEIPNSVTSIEEYAFSFCYSLKSVLFGENSLLTNIGERAFYWCVNLTSMEIPNSVTSVARGAFNDCYKLIIYCDVKSQPTGWNSQWNELDWGCYCPTVWDCKNNNIADDGYIYGITVEGINYAIKDSVAKVVGTNASEEIVISRTVAYNSVIYPVTSIGKRSFYMCFNLTNIEIPNSIISIEEYAFYICPKLTICCEAESQPSGWDTNWNYSNCPIVWGYNGE